MKLVFNVFTGNLDYVASTPGDVGIVFPLAPNLGGTGIANAAGSTLTLGGATTVPAPGGTVALLATANIFTAVQTVRVDSATAFIVQKDATTNALVVNTTTGEATFGRPGMAAGSTHNFWTGNTGTLTVNADTGGSPSFFFKSGATNRGYFAMNIFNTGDMVFYLYATPAGIKFYISPAGLIGLGVGNTSPATRLHVQHTTTTTNAILETFRLESQVSTAATGGANGFGVGQTFYAETATNATYQQQGLVATYWVDATNASRKATLALSAYDTAERKGIEIRANGSTPDIVLLGDTWWEGEGFGLPYGSCSSNDTDINWTQAAAVQNTWYDISDADMVDGQLNLVTHDGSGQLTVTKGGRYLINYGLVAESNAANTHLETAISVSGTESGFGISHAEAVTPNVERNFNGTAILDLAANATINLSIRTTDAGGPNLKVEMMDITLVMVGGT